MFLDDLTPKQRLFVEAYLGKANFNATKAAKIAGYSEKTAHSIGGENLRKPSIQAAISRRLDEAAMPANEVLARLADHARGSIDDFARVDDAGGVTLDFQRAEAAGKLHLVHELSFTEHGPKIRLYDAQAALVQIGRHHKLFTDRTEVTGADGEPFFPPDVQRRMMDDPRAREATCDLDAFLAAQDDQSGGPGPAREPEPLADDAPPGSAEPQTDDGGST